MCAGERPLNSGVRLLMSATPAPWFVALVLAPCWVLASDVAPLKTLRKVHPEGVPWSIELTDGAGKGLGRLEVLITDQSARSCLSSIGPGAVRIEYLAKDGPISRIVTSPYGVGKFDGSTVQIDLTGDTCDAYVILGGEMLADGSSSGELYTLGIRSGQTLGAFHAKVR